MASRPGTTTVAPCSARRDTAGTPGEGAEGGEASLIGRAPEVEVDRQAGPQLGRQLDRCPEGEEPAALEDGDTTAQTGGFGQEVGAQHHRRAVIHREGADEIEDVARGRRVEARRRFVEEQHVGLMEHGPSQRHALALPGRESLGAPIGLAGHPEPVE